METARQTPHLAQGVWAIIGGLLIIVSFFLPSIPAVNTGSAPISPNSGQTLVSAWSYIIPFFQPGNSFNYATNTNGGGEPHIFAGLLSAAPMILAAIIVILGVWALFRRPGAIRSALLYTAVTLVALSLFTYTDTVFLNLSITSSELAHMPGTQLLFLGSFVFKVGGFVSIVAAFLTWQSGRKA